MNKKHEEKRKSNRIPVQFDVTILHEEDYLISFTRDISADGMFINTQTPLSKGEKITVGFTIGAEKAISVKAKIVWVNMEGPEVDRGMGVKFINVSPKMKKNILLLVNRIAILPDDALIN
ncbi:MAG: PilZ domain-containing protein [Proteobacteria bacterium]|nr:PilZ domain-containing protein [Pseudomonadota bacterium]MBU4294838.1 PilZ domain-containing protein [Pseudomonadota bacterium]MCG2749338.1 PilZ domain-containing protein [Desulfobulbaceae bacterium]